MAERRQFDGSTVFEPGMLFETGDQAYGGDLGQPGGTKRELTAGEDADTAQPAPRYIPPATLELLLSELAQRGGR